MAIRIGNTYVNQAAKQDPPRRHPIAAIAGTVVAILVTIIGGLISVEYGLWRSKAAEKERPEMSRSSIEFSIE